MQRSQGPPTPPAAAEPAEAPPRPVGHGPVVPAPILVVDDDEPNLKAASGILEELGHPVVRAASGKEALRCVLGQEFAVILLDVLMPGMDGYETAALIRSRTRSRHVPIIFLSALSRDSAQLFRGYSTGAVDFMFKPIEPMILRSKVSVFVDLYTKAHEIRRQAEEERRLLAENLRVQSRQMQMAEALERSVLQQSVIIDALPVAFYAASDAEGFRVRSFAGGSPHRICGFTPEDFLASDDLWLSRIHPDDRRAVLAGLARLPRTGRFECEYRWRCGDGEYRWFSDRGVLARRESGDAEMFGIWLDVMERRGLEQQLLHAQKMEALGRMTGGIAHDFNNMLTVVLGSLERSLPLVRDNAVLERRIRMAIDGAVRCSDLTRRLLGFARRQALEPRRLRLDEQASQLRGLLERTMGERYTVETDCPADLWAAVADPSQLEAAILNLAINARDAMPSGGQVRIEGANQVVDATAAERLDIAPGDYVRLSVLDNGTGMPPEIAAKAVEPFFTTKDHGKGTGLGLSTIYGFVRQSRGALVIESEVGKGTAVHLYLPRAAAEPAAEEPASMPALPEPDLRGGKVLIVEDDAEVREIAVAMFGDLGCTILEAETAAEGMAVLRQHPDLALLFTDLALPGDQDGVQLAREAVALRPGLPVLLCSAHLRSSLAELVPGGRCHFLPKPYRSPELKAALQALYSTGVAAAEADAPASEPSGAEAALRSQVR